MEWSRRVSPQRARFDHVNGGDALACDVWFEAAAYNLHFGEFRHALQFLE